jgi:hypothetical protein
MQIRASPRATSSDTPAPTFPVMRTSSPTFGNWPATQATPL